MALSAASERETDSRTAALHIHKLLARPPSQAGAAALTVETGDMSGPQAHATLRTWIKEKMHVTSPALLWFLLRGYILNGSSVTKGMLEVTCTNSFFYLFGDSLMLMLLSCHNHELSSGDKNVSACNFNSQPRNLRHSIKNLAKNNYSVKCRRIDGDTAASPPLLAATLYLTNNVIINPGHPSCQ